MKTENNAKQVVIYINSSDQWQGRPLYSAIVQRCQEMGLAGATVVRCAEGFGASHQLHTTRLLTLSDNLPVRLEIIDVPERVEPLLKALGEMIDQGLVAVCDVHVFRFQRESKA